MSRLINAEHLLFLIDSSIALRELANIPTSELKSIRECVSEEPTAYNVDQVVEELEEIGKKYCENIDCHMYQNCDGCEHKDLMECAIEIVRNGGVKNG